MIQFTLLVVRNCGSTTGQSPGTTCRFYCNRICCLQQAWKQSITTSHLHITRRCWMWSGTRGAWLVWNRGNHWVFTNCCNKRKNMEKTTEKVKLISQPEWILTPMKLKSNRPHQATCKIWSQWKITWKYTSSKVWSALLLPNPKPCPNQNVIPTLDQYLKSTPFTLTLDGPSHPLHERSSP